MGRTIRDEDDPGVAFENVTVMRCTAKAAHYDFGGFDHWVPHSCIHDDSPLYYDLDELDMNVSGPERLVIKTWFAEKEGLA